MRRALIAGATIATLGMPAVAQAHRPATSAEKSAMMYHAGSRIDHLSAKEVDAPSSEPLKCGIADVSTVDKSWGGWTFNSAMFTACQRWAADGVVLEHKIGGRWFVIAEGSSFTTLPAKLSRKVFLDVTSGLH